MKFLIVSICILGLVGSVIGATVFGATATVTSTVTAKESAISRTDSEGTIQHGAVSVGTTTSTSPGIEGAATTTFSNDGSEALFDITSGDSGNWTAENAVGTNQFVHKFTTSTDDCDTACWWVTTGIDAAYVTASSTVDAGAVLDVHLQLNMPSSSGFYTSQSIIVTVQATAN